MLDSDVLVVGGGISGLAAASFLTQKGFQVGLWEKQRQPGGKIQSNLERGYLTEQSASMILDIGSTLGPKLQSLGINEYQIQDPKQHNRYLVKAGELVVMPNHPKALFKSPLLSAQGKLRVCLEPFVPRSNNLSESVAEFISRRFGREMLEAILEAYIGGPLASDAELASASNTLPRLTGLEQRYGSLSMGFLLSRLLQRKKPTTSLTFAKGMSNLVLQLLQQRTFHLETDCEAVSIQRHGRHWRVEGRSSGQSVYHSTRKLIICTPAWVAHELLRHLDQDLGENLKHVEYAPIDLVHLGWDKTTLNEKLKGTGFLVPKREGLWLNGCQWSSSLNPERSPSDKTLMTCYLGGARHPECQLWDQQKLLTTTIEELHRLKIINGDPEFVRIDRHAQGLPLYHHDYQTRINRLKNHLNRLPSLHLFGNYIDGVSVRDRINNAAILANSIADNIVQPYQNQSILARPYLKPATSSSTAGGASI